MIDLQPSQEQQQIIDSVSSLLAENFPLSARRSGLSPWPVANSDSQKWPKLGRLGAFGLGLSAEYGGVGYGVVEEVLVCREFGRFLLSPGVLATMLGAHVAAYAGDMRLAAAIRSGDEPVAEAIAFAPNSATLAGRYHLIDGAEADWMLVQMPAGVGLIPRATWCERESLACIDSTLTLERARLHSTADSLWVAASDWPLPRRGLLLASAYLVGLAEAACRDSVEYASIRQQFGQPIGAFQAVKHRCADMLARGSAAWNLTIFAALAELANAADAAFQGISAKIVATDAAYRNAAANIQNHGAIGFTGEFHAHLYVKRAHVIDRVGGDLQVQKKRLLEQPSPFERDPDGLA